MERVEAVALLRQRMLQMALEEGLEQRHLLGQILQPTEVLVELVELPLPGQVGLAFCKETARHLPARLVAPETVGCHLQQLPPRSQEAHLVHLEEELRPLTLRLLEQRVAGG